MIEINGEKYYTPREAADFHGVTRATIYNWVAGGVVDVIHGGRTYLIPESELKSVTPHGAGKKIATGFIYAWPYNLLKDIFQDDRLQDGMSKDQESGLEAALATLTEREREVIKLRYEEDLTLEEVGKRFGVTRERVRQVESKAVRKLRHPSRRKLIENGYKVATEEIYNREMERFKEEIERARADAEKAIAEYKFICEHPSGDAKVPKGEFAIRDMNIADLELSIRAHNCLIRSGCRTVGDILEKDNQRMMRVRNLGRKSLKEIYDRLEKEGVVKFDNGELMSVYEV